MHFNFIADKGRAFSLAFNLMNVDIDAISSSDVVRNEVYLAMSTCFSSAMLGFIFPFLQKTSYCCIIFDGPR